MIATGLVSGFSATDKIKLIPGIQIFHETFEVSRLNRKECHRENVLEGKHAKLAGSVSVPLTGSLMD